MFVVAALAVVSNFPWIMVKENTGVTVYLGTRDTEIDHKNRAYKTWVRFSYHGVPRGQIDEAMTLNTFNCAQNTVHTWTIIESFANAPPEVSHPKDGPQRIPPSTYYADVKDAVFYILKSSE